MSELTCLEICAGAGGQSHGLELADFGHALALEIDPDAAETLRLNRPDWNVVEGDVRDLDGAQFHGVDLLAGGSCGKSARPRSCWRTSKGSLSASSPTTVKL